MQTPARQAPSGLTSNSLTRGRSLDKTQRVSVSARTLSRATVFSPNKTVAAVVAGAANANGAVAEARKKSRRFIW